MWLCSHGNLTGEAFKLACDKYWKTFDSTHFPAYHRKPYHGKKTPTAQKVSTQMKVE